MANDKVDKNSAESQGTSTSEAKPVDIDAINVKLVILCSQKSALDSCANYLNRRGWEATVTSDLRALFKLIGAATPDFVMVSVNMTSSKVGQLPKIIAQSFNIPVITFGEKSDTKTLKLLHDIRANYTLQGTATGPSVQRRIKNILQEMYAPTPEAVKEVNKEDAVLDQETSSKIQQKLKSKFNLVVSAEDGARDQKGKFNRDEDNSNSVANNQSDEELRDEQQMAEIDEELKRQTREMKASANAAAEERSKKRSSSASSESVDAGVIVAKGSSKYNDSGVIVAKGIKTNSQGSIIEEGAENSIMSEMSTDEGLSHQQAENSSEGAVEDDLSIAELIELAKRGSQAREDVTKNDTNLDGSIIELDKTEDSIGSVTTEDAENKTEAFQTIKQEQEQMRQAAEEIKAIYNQPLEKLDEEKQNTVVQHIFEYCATMACIEKVGEPKGHIEMCRMWPVGYAKQKGLLLIAHSGDEKSQSEYIYNFFKILNKEIKERSKGIAYETEIPVVIDHETLVQPFEGEVFTRKLQSGSSEVIVKLLPSMNIEPLVEFESQNSENKGRIRISDLTPDMPPGVNLYLHMPTNQKYVLYIKADTNLLEKQYSKLKTADAKMYINQEDVDKYVHSVKVNKTMNMLKKSSPKKKSKAS